MIGKAETSKDFFPRKGVKKISTYLPSQYNSSGRKKWGIFFSRTVILTIYFKIVTQSKWLIRDNVGLLVGLLVF